MSEIDWLSGPWAQIVGLTSDLRVQVVGLPFLLSWLSAGVLRLLLGPDRGGLVSGAAIGIGFLAAYVAMFDVPPWPPVSSVQKLFFIALAAVLLGTLADFMRIRGEALGASALALTLGAVIWLAWPLVRGFDPTGVGIALVVWAGAGVVQMQLERAPSLGVAPVLMLATAACGLALLVLHASSTLMAQLAGAFAASSLGFALWTWPESRFAFASSAVIGAAVPLAAIAAILALFGNIEPLALIPLMGVFVADRVGGALVPGRGLSVQFLRFLIAVLAAVVSVLAAVGLQSLLQDPLLWF